MAIHRLGTVIIAGLLAGIGQAQAQSCEQNFSTNGVPMLTALSFKTWQEFPKVRPAVALDNVARAVAADGYANISVNKSLGAVSAEQETSGSGRPQDLRLVVRKKGAGVRVDAHFQVQLGQVTTDAAVRQALCDLIRAAAN